MNEREKSRLDELYQKHVRALKLHGYADKTIEAYSLAVRRVAEQLDRCPDHLTREELETYFVDLVASHSWSTVKLDRNGLRFFYENVVGRELPWINLIKAPVIKSLPDVLTQQEIARIVLRTEERRFQTFWFVTYTLGLRLGETLHLEVGDIDGEQRRVHVRRGKGNRDRFVILPKLTLVALRRHWTSHRHPRLLFPGRVGGAGAPASGVMDRSTTQHAFKRVVADCGIHKHVSIHSLRHAYATHLIEAGLNLRAIQEQLGHANPTTTARYVRMTEKSRGDGAAIIDGMVATLAAALRLARTEPRS